MKERSRGGRSERRAWLRCPPGPTAPSPVRAGNSAKPLREQRGPPGLGCRLCLSSASEQTGERYLGPAVSKGPGQRGQGPSLRKRVSLGCCAGLDPSSARVASGGGRQDRAERPLLLAGREMWGRG